MTDTPYGKCYHTKYEGCPPCIHDVYLRSLENAETHEPECLHIGIGQDPKTCVGCESIRAAYKRGREDAAKAIRRVPVQQIEEALLMFYWPAIAAAIDGDLE